MKINNLKLVAGKNFHIVKMDFYSIDGHFTGFK